MSFAALLFLGFGLLLIQSGFNLVSRYLKGQRNKSGANFWPTIKGKVSRHETQIVRDSDNDYSVALRTHCRWKWQDQIFHGTLSLPGAIFHPQGDIFSAREDDPKFAAHQAPDAAIRQSAFPA